MLRLSSAAAGLGLALLITPQIFGHLHIQSRYADGHLTLFLYDFDAGEFSADEVPLVVSAAAREYAPVDARYHNLLGAPGSPVYILPQHEKPGILNLGIGSSAPSTSTFSGNQTHLRLLSVEGPGHFAVYTIDGFGNPHIRINTRDGIDENDVVTLSAAGGHLHINWAFSAPGTYRITFQTSGLLQQGQTHVFSEPQTFTFPVIRAVPQAPSISSPRRENGDITFALHSEPGSRVSLEQAAISGAWSVLTNVYNPSGMTEVRLPIDSTFKMFRAVSE